MYSTCLFCYGTLGSNDVIEWLPVGRRIAFDPANGRLWVVCARCERWNLVPIEERWEAVEECERLSANASARARFEQISIARLPGGVEIVRIGSSLSNTSWRRLAWSTSPSFRPYWRAISRRRRLRLLGRIAASTGSAGLIVAAVSAVPAAAAVVVPVLSYGAYAAWRNRWRVVARLKNEYGWDIDVSAVEARRTELFAVDGEIALRVFPRADEMILRGRDAVWALGLWLPRLNLAGAGPTRVRDAAEVVEKAGGPAAVFEQMGKSDLQQPRHQRALSELPHLVRLALEMAATGEIEGTTTEAELLRLERAWREAEEIAAIADRLIPLPFIEGKIRRWRNGTLAG